MSRSKLTKKNREILAGIIRARNDYGPAVKQALAEIDRLTRENRRLSGLPVKPRAPITKIPPKLERDAAYAQLRERNLQGKQPAKKRW